MTTSAHRPSISAAAAAYLALASGYARTLPLDPVTRCVAPPSNTPVWPDKLPTRIPIVLYHSIGDNAAPGFRHFTVKPEALAAQLDYLHDNNYTAVSLRQFANVVSRPGVALPARPIVLTFDDGYADFYTRAFPLLLQHGFVATLFISTDFVGRTSAWLAREGAGHRPILNWTQLAELSAYGMEIASHGHSHAPLDLMTPVAAREEIVHSKLLLEQHLGVPVTSFAYPYGWFNRVIRSLLREGGYSAACTVRYAVTTLNDDCFSLARVPVGHTATTRDFQAVLAGRGMGGLKARARLWRWMRAAAGLARR